MNFRLTLVSHCSSVRFSSSPPGRAAGAVDQDVQSLEAVVDLLHEPLDVLAVAHVGLDRQHFGLAFLPQLPGRLLQALPIARADRHVGTLAQERVGAGVADPLAATGDHRDLAP
jgi:hypothetical protein